MFNAFKKEDEYGYMKDAVLNMKISTHLYNAVKAEAEKRNISIAAYVRAVLARQVFSKQTQNILGEKLFVTGDDGEFLLDV